MQDLSQFGITRRWPPKDTDKIQLYSFPTPNGVKISIALEELGLAYEPHLVTLSDTDVKSREFLSLNPNNKIPAIIDPNGPDGAPIGLFESGAILLYLAEKTGQLIGSNAVDKAHITQWLMFQMGGLGPMLGAARRLWAVIDTQLEGQDWIAREYSIADIAIAPWLRALDFYEARDVVGWSEHKNAVAYLERFLERPAVQTGLVTPVRPD